MEKPKMTVQQKIRLARQLTLQCPENKEDADNVLEYMRKMIANEHGEAVIMPIKGLTVVGG